MNQEKIGKFILKCRKNKKITQAELAEKLGVTEKSISNWENGRNMPDLSLFKPLCEELDISINELLSGEEISKEEYQNKLEENIINTITYTTEKEKKHNKKLGIILIIVGILISIIAFILSESDNSFGSIMSILGGVVALIGCSKLTWKLKSPKRLIINFTFFILYVVLLFFIDFASVTKFHQPPRFIISKEYYENIIIYKAPFYNVFRVNVDTPNEYYLIDYDKEYTYETVPISPFDREKYGVDVIKKYRSKNVEDNINDENLLNNLPLSEFKEGFQIDSENLGLIVNYKFETNVNFKYNIDNISTPSYDIETAMLYNSLALFSLIDNVKYMTFNIENVLNYNGETNNTITSYHVTRESLKNNYYYYKYLFRGERYEYFFNKFVEKKMNDKDFVKNNFKEIFIDDNVMKTKKIEVIRFEEGYTEGDIENSKYYYNEKVLKTITDEKIINELINILDSANPIPENTPITFMGTNMMLKYYDENDNLLVKTIIYPSTKYYYFDSYFIHEDDKENFNILIKELFQK